MSISEPEDRTDGYDRGDEPIKIDALIREARAGSTAALGQLMEGCRKYLLLVAHHKLDSVLRPKAGASDLVQETFCDAQRDFAQFRGESEQEFFAWLTGIMNHRMANHIRHFRTRMRDVRREASLDTENQVGNVTAKDLTPGGHALQRDEESQLRGAMARLPEPLRQVLILRTWERQSFVDIGATLGISSDVARERWTSAVRRLSAGTAKAGR